jgi:hypothetical protein
MAKLDIIVKITDNKGIQVGRTVYLFNKPRVVVGFWNNSLVFATDNPKTMPEAQVLIYTSDELKEFHHEGCLQGLIEL